MPDTPPTPPAHRRKALRPTGPVRKGHLASSPPGEPGESGKESDEKDPGPSAPGHAGQKLSPWEKLVAVLAVWLLLLLIGNMVDLCWEWNTPERHKKLEGADRTVASVLRQMQPLAVAGRFYDRLLQDRGVALYQWSAPMNAAVARETLAKEYPRLTLTCGDWRRLYDQADVPGPDGSVCRLVAPEDAPAALKPASPSFLSAAALMPSAGALPLMDAGDVDGLLDLPPVTHLPPTAAEMQALHQWDLRRQARRAAQQARLAVRQARHAVLEQDQLVGDELRREAAVSAAAQRQASEQSYGAKDAADRVAYAAALRRIDRLVLLSVQPAPGEGASSAPNTGSLTFLYTAVLGLPDAYLDMVRGLLPRSWAAVAVLVVSLAFLAALRVGRKDSWNGFVFLLILPVGVSLAAGGLSLASRFLHAATGGHLTWASFSVTITTAVTSFIASATPEVIKHQAFEGSRAFLGKSLKIKIFAEE